MPWWPWAFLITLLKGRTTREQSRRATSKSRPVEGASLTAWGPGILISVDWLFPSFQMPLISLPSAQAPFLADDTCSLVLVSDLSRPFPCSWLVNSYIQLCSVFPSWGKFSQLPQCGQISLGALSQWLEISLRVAFTCLVWLLHCWVMTTLHCLGLPTLPDSK